MTDRAYLLERCLRLEAEATALRSLSDRAAVLGALARADAPLTTPAVAAATCLDPQAVARHLRALRDAGLAVQVRASRCGRPALWRVR